MNFFGLPYIPLICAIIMLTILVVVAFRIKGSIVKLAATYFLVTIVLIPMIVLSTLSIIQSEGIDIPWEQISVFFGIASISFTSFLAIYLHFMTEDKREKREEELKPKMHFKFEIITFEGNQKAAMIWVINDGITTVKNIVLSIAAFYHNGKTTSLKLHFFNIGDLNPTRSKNEIILTFEENIPTLRGFTDEDIGEDNLGLPLELTFYVDAEELKPMHGTMKINENLDHDELNIMSYDDFLKEKMKKHQDMENSKKNNISR